MHRRAALPPLAVALASALALAGCSGGGGGGGGAPGGSSCALPAASSLQVVESAPAQGADGVSVNATVRIRFNTCVDTATLAGALSFRRGTTPVPFTPAYDAATATLVLTPAAPLALSTSYAVFILPTARGARGEPFAGWVLGFDTRGAPDTVAPAVAADPAGGHFNHPVDVTIACADEPGGSGCAQTVYAVNGGAPQTYVGPVRLEATATLTFFALDGEGNRSATGTGTYVIDVDPPGVASVFPPDGATGVPLDVVPAAAFDEDMDPATVTAARLTLAPAQATGAAYDPATRTARFPPDRRLECGTTYTATIDPGVTDLAGNGLPAAVSWTFTTDPDCVEPVTTASVTDGVYAAPQQVTLTCADAGGSGCARVVYTTDGSAPAPGNGTVVEGAAAGPIAVGEGETLLRYYSVDRAGNREAVRQQRYSVSTTGFTYVATTGGLARGAGAVPARFVALGGAGWTYAFHRDPVTGRLWRATERGVAGSDDGAAWALTRLVSPTNGWLLPGLAVWAEGSLVLAGTEEGVFRSVDGGATFVPLLQRTMDGNDARVTAIAGAGKDVYVATSLGLAVSHDRARTFAWTVADRAVADVVLDAGTGDVFAATSTGLLRSTDGGATFARLDTGTVPALPSADVRAVAVTADRVYAATAAGLAILGRDATGAPASATSIARPCPAGETSILDVAVSGQGVWVVSGQRYWSGSTDAFCASADGGATFAPRWFVAPDSTAAIASTVYAEGARVYVGYAPGFFLSTDAGATFRSAELPAGGVRDVAAAGGSLYAALDSGVAVSTDGFRTFVLRTKADGLGNPGVEDLAAAGTRVYAVTTFGLSVSSDGGATFAPPATLTNAAMAACVAAPDASTVYLGQMSWLQVSTDGGAHFTQRLPPAGSTSYLSDTVGVDARGGTVAVAARDTVFVSTDGGVTFAERGAAAGLVAPASYTLSLRGVAVAPSGAIHVASNVGLFSSTDGGATFIAAAGGPAWLDAVSASGPALYLGGDLLHVSTDGGATFVSRGAVDGLPGRPGPAVYVP
ncbi:Ig-like domain-containing protein [Anaeromyxobacter dehalogenans]|uniref:Ig-like domain-containing protein n=1 Tax=Anaeromyxobacter dehalogenans TaxID=161493 RepID=UPI000051CFE8|nr:Ig-like domain-containing protein [Anaeromyxobacter dehalogenans]